MSNFNPADKILLRFGRYKVGTPTTNSQPGAHTGNSRQYIPGFSDSNIIFLDTASGNDANSGATEGSPKLTYASAATAAGSTKKIRVINDGATLSTNITKPTEMKRGLSGTISSNIAALFNTWSSGTASGSQTVERVIWSRVAGRFIMLTTNVGGGTVQTSTTGTSFSTISTGLTGTNNPYGIAESNDLILLLCTNGVFSSTDGLSISTAQPAPPSTAYLWSVRYFEAAGRFVVGGADSYIYHWAPGDTAWTAVQLSPVSADLNISAIHKNTILFAGNRIDGVDTVIDTFILDKNFALTRGETLSIGTSANGMASDGVKIVMHVNSLASIAARVSYDDGLTWESTGVARYSDPYNHLYYVPEISRWFCGSAADYAQISTDGINWTASSAGSSSSRGRFAYGPTLGRLVGPPSSNLLYYCDIAVVSVEANIAGFTVNGLITNGGFTAYNCTIAAFQTPHAVNLNACRVNGYARINNNTQSHFATLFTGEAFFTSAPASANAFALNCNTFAGNVYLYNSSATGYEQIRDNVIVGDFAASYAVTMLSGNIQGERSNIITAKGVSYSDPVFSDTTDYKLSRLTNGNTQDSPLCNKASYYVNEQGQPRDLGAWSEDDSTLSYGYRYAAYFNKPAGQGIKPQKVPAASADQGLDGTWDGVNEPERATEWLTLAYQAAVPMDHLTNLDLFESLTDMTCDISLAPENAAPDTAVTVNGNHAAGDIVLNIDASSTIKAGMILEISGVKYYILYTATGSSPTKLVLHKPLETAVSDNASITPQEPPADGTYQYVPQMRETPRPHSHETEYVNGLLLKFVRQYPQL